MSQKSIARSKKARLAAAGAAMALSLSIAAPGIASAQEQTPESSSVEQPATEEGTESGAPTAEEGATVEGSATVDGQIEAPAPAVTPEDAAAAAAAAVPAPEVPSAIRPLPQVTGGVVFNDDPDALSEGQKAVQALLDGAN